MQGGEIFVPKMPSMKIVDLAEAISSNMEIDIVGIGHGEKVHETLLTEDEARRTVKFSDFYVVKPTKYSETFSSNLMMGEIVPEHFRYSSDSNDWWLTIKEIRDIIKESSKEENISLRAAID